ncbi:MAG TPA: hypothetical protein PLP33_31025 [Leptospiraceae bacterium]|nr:hypothetical protein [Leptospiraceae bacterium]
MGVTFKPEKKSNSGVKFTPENPDTPITNKYQDYFEPKEIDLEEDETSFPQALNLGAQQGLTAFHADELKDKLYNYLLKRKGLPEDTTYLPQVREEYVKAKEDRPWTTLIGNVGGGILGATGAAMAAPYLASSALPVAAGTSLLYGILNRGGESKKEGLQAYKEAITEHPYATAFDLALPFGTARYMKGLKPGAKAAKNATKSKSELEKVVAPLTDSPADIDRLMSEAVTPNSYLERVSTMQPDDIGRESTRVTQEALENIRNPQGTGQFDIAGKAVGDYKSKVPQLPDQDVTKPLEMVDEFLGSRNYQKTQDLEPIERIARGTKDMSDLNKIRSLLEEGQLNSQDVLSIVEDLDANKINHARLVGEISDDTANFFKRLRGELKSGIHKSLPESQIADERFSEIAKFTPKKLKPGISLEGKNLDDAIKAFKKLGGRPSLNEREEFVRVYGPEMYEKLQQMGDIGIAEKLNVISDRSPSGVVLSENPAYKKLSKEFTDQSIGRNRTIGGILGGIGGGALGAALPYTGLPGQASMLGGAFLGSSMGQGITKVADPLMKSMAASKAGRMVKPQQIFVMAKKAGLDAQKAAQAAELAQQFEQMTLQDGLDQATYWIQTIPIAQEVRDFLVGE